MSEDQFTDLILYVDELPVTGHSLEIKALILELVAKNARLTLELCLLRSKKAIDDSTNVA